jgi:hypothetical protein
MIDNRPLLQEHLDPALAAGNAALLPTLEELAAGQ